MTSRRGHIAFKIVVSACVAYLVVRLGQELPRGYSSDEIAIIKPIGDFGARYLLLHGDVAANPPLHVLLFGLLGNAETMPIFGRCFSAICALAAVAVAARVAYRTASGDLTAAATAAAIVALNPMTAVAGATFRPDAWLVLTLLLRFAAMEALLRERGEVAWPGRRPAWAAYLGLTALLPWIHYGAIPLLVFEAPGLALAGKGPRRLLAGHAAAGFFALPLLALVLLDHAQLAGTRGHLELVTLLGGGLETLGLPLLGDRLRRRVGLPKRYRSVTGERAAGAQRLSCPPE